MHLVFETRHFTLVVPQRPHVARSDGGHLVIHPKVPVEDRTRLTSEQAIELVKLSMVAGEAMTSVLRRRGIDLGRINYQDNGNWRQTLHLHLYGRAKDALLQPWGHALAFPPTAAAFRDRTGQLEALSGEDAAALAAENTRLWCSAKYRAL